ncbi:hypothetical protein MED121_09790 [Marinomonas sp. MED121]|nr:hypothetical protein MED121_09790 [Marinomonas sp. MED121]
MADRTVKKLHTEAYCKPTFTITAPLLHISKKRKGAKNGNIDGLNLSVLNDISLPLCQMATNMRKKI